MPVVRVRARPPIWSLVRRSYPPRSIALSLANDVASAIPPIPFRAKYAWRSSGLGRTDGRTEPTEAISRSLIVGTEVAAADDGGRGREGGREGEERRSQS